jgi:hypothetical protein
MSAASIQSAKLDTDAAIPTDDAFPIAFAFMSSANAGVRVRIPMFEPTSKLEVNRPVPETSRVYAGVVVPIPTLLLLIVILATPAVSKVNCEVPPRCMPVDRSAEKL